MTKTSRRIDQLLVERGLAESRSKAQRLIMAGQVRMEGELVHKPSIHAEPNADIEVAEGPRFVSRGGEKLAAALSAFDLDPSGWECADIGASTGGFTDCLLQAGAARVFAIDVGYGVLHWRLRSDPRVELMERTNARDLEALPEGVQLVVIDASFISLRLLLPQAVKWLLDDGQIVALVKPQFEAGKGQVGKGGVVRDPEVHRSVLETVLAAAAEQGLAPSGLIRSPLKGPKGNVEFLLWLRPGDPDSSARSYEQLLNSAL